MSPAASKKKTPKTAPAATPSVASPKLVRSATEGQKALAKSAANIIQKMTGQKRIAEQKGVMPHLPSGSTIIDTLINGTALTEDNQLMCPGYPSRRIIEIYGPESSGKTTVALCAVAQVQQRGGVAMYLDTEHALNHRYARSCGVRFDDSFMLYQPDTMEDCFKMMVTGITLGINLIVVDSVASMVPKSELEKKLDDAAKIGIVAQKMSINLPKFALWLSKFPQDKDKKPISTHPGTTLVLLNQERSKIDTSGGKGGGGDNDPNTTGGKALKFYTYLRLRFQKVRSEYIKRKDPTTGKEKSYQYGNVTAVKVVKTKVIGNQGHSGLIFIRYGFGLDDLYSLIEVGQRARIIGRDGAYFTFEGQRWQGKDKFRAHLLEDPAMAENLKKLVTQSLMSSAVKPLSDADLTPEDEITEMANLFDEEEDEGEVETDAEDGYVETEGEGDEGSEDNDGEPDAEPGDVAEAEAEAESE